MKGKKKPARAHADPRVDALERYNSGGKVFGFELELVASERGLPALMEEAERISSAA